MRTIMLCALIFILSLALLITGCSLHEVSKELSNYKQTADQFAEDTALTKRLEMMIRELKPDIAGTDLDKYVNAIMAASAKYELHPMLIASIIMRESSFRPEVKGSKLPTKNRCIGSMQIHPVAQKSKLQKRNIKPRDLYNIAINVDVGSEVLKEFLVRYDWNVRKALLGYLGSTKQRLDYTDDIIRMYVMWTSPT